MDLERAHFLVTQAFEEDEKGNDDEAIELYTQAVELCIKTVDLHFLLSLIVITLSVTATSCYFIFSHVMPVSFHICFSFQQSNETSDQALQTKLKQLARQALDR